jgi:hypothetical protein
MRPSARGIRSSSCTVRREGALFKYGRTILGHGDHAPAIGQVTNDQALEWVEAEKLYEDPRATAPDEKYPDFKSYFEARLKKPFTLWIEMEQTHRYVTKYAPDLIERALAGST